MNELDLLSYSSAVLLQNCSKKYYLYKVKKVKKENMKKIKDMIESAPTKRAAMSMLETWRIFGNVSDAQYMKARELIRKEFEK